MEQNQQEKPHVKWLREHGACHDGLVFAAQYATLRDAWYASKNVNHLAWVAFTALSVAREKALAPHGDKHALAMKRIRRKRDLALRGKRNGKAREKVLQDFYTACDRINEKYIDDIRPIRVLYDTVYHAVNQASCTLYVHSFRNTIVCPELL